MEVPVSLTVEKEEYPLIREYHDEFEDVYVWKGLPGGFSRVDLYFVAGLVIIVFGILIIQGERNLTNYGITFLILVALSALYKGMKVGIDSINYSPYKSPLITRLADKFLIWGRDPPLEITSNMTVVIRNPSPTQAGVVYLYDDNERHIVFLAQKKIYLQQFSEIISDKYGLKIGDPVVS